MAMATPLLYKALRMPKECCMESTEIEYRTTDTAYKGTLYHQGDGTDQPAVLVLPDAYGLTPFAHEQARRVAALGYTALTADLYGAGRHVQTFEEASARAGTLSQDAERQRATVRAGMDWLAKRVGGNIERVAAIGFCLGGALALELARSGYACAGVATFHGLLKTNSPAKQGTVQCPILVNTGADDPLVPLEHVTAFQREMSEAQADCQIVIHTGAGHSFTRRDGVKRPGFGYNAAADSRAWRLLGEWLSESFSQRN
jgi:dienelactone hydrolase